MQCTHSWYAKIADTGNRLFFALPQKLFRSCSTGPRQSITLASLTNPNQPNRSGMPENLSHPVSAGRQIHVVGKRMSMSSILSSKTRKTTAGQMQFKTEFNSSHALPLLWFGHNASSLLRLYEQRKSFWFFSVK